MKRKDPGETRSLKGHYAITSAVLQRACDILKEAYGSCEIEINDYELDGLHELPQIPDGEVTQVKILGRRKPTEVVWVTITEHVLSITQVEKYDFTAIGIVARLAEVFERAKITPKVAEFWPATCEISLMSATEGPVAVPVSLLDLDKVAQAVDKSFWKCNKDKIIVGIILAAFTLVGGIVLAALRGCL
jgi:hypothetical protein